MEKVKLIGTLGANTGKTVGDVRMGAPKHIMLTQSFEFTEEQLADSDSIKAAIEAAILLPRSNPNKLYVFTGFREVDDNTGDDNVQALADGFEERLTEAIAKYVLRHTAGVAQTQSFEAFSGWSDKIFVIDDKNILWMVFKSAGGGKGHSVGYLSASYPKFRGTSNINTGIVRVSLGTVDEFKNGSLVARKLNFSMTELQEIVDVSLAEADAAAGYVFTIGASNTYAGTNIYSIYKDLLNVIGAWKATRQDTGADVPISAVAKDDALEAWDVTLDNATPIAAGVLVKIELKDPAALAALGTPVTGIESGYVIVTKPA